ncbi:hypothetical protein ILUMI_24126 [Ignelater luminosus]|uniref:Uncharacterized protein n=1 Tax=Ignelater luminosus TaxID=2038154 RepID=A0A8K0CB52_IGNLU|nr:hypothetical protein ILUMI_24126 [Ignelater luminosus]
MEIEDNNQIPFFHVSEEKTRWKPRSHGLPESHTYRSIPQQRFSPPPSLVSLGGQDLSHKITKTSRPEEQKPRDIKKSGPQYSKTDSPRETSIRRLNLRNRRQRKKKKNQSPKPTYHM